MGWSGLIWVLRMSCVLLQMLSSFKALKKPAVRQRRTREANEVVRTTLSSTERARRKVVKEQLMGWVVLACFRTVERVSDVAMGWIPLYEEGKIMMLVSILVWRGAGAQLVFTKLIAPSIKPYERPLDFCGHITNDILEVATYLLLLGPRWLRRKILATQKPNIPNILVSLRKPGQPAVSRQIADSIEVAQSLSRDPAPPSRPTTYTRTIVKTVEQHHLAPPSSKPFRPVTNATASSSRTVSGNGLAKRSSSQNLQNYESNGVPSQGSSGPLYPSLAGLTTTNSKGKEKATEDFVPPGSFGQEAVARGRQPRAAAVLPNTYPRPIMTGPQFRISHSLSISHSAVPRPSTPSPPPFSRASSIVPDTPAPPGAFVSRSISKTPRKSAPLRNPILDIEEDFTPSEMPQSPRQKALSAIAGLSTDLTASISADWGTNRGTSGPMTKNGKRRATSEIPEEEGGSPGKRKKVSSSTSKLSRSTSSLQAPLPRSRATSARRAVATETKPVTQTLAKSRSSATLAKSKSTATLGKRKAKEKVKPEKEEDSGEETAKEDSGPATLSRRTSVNTTSSIPVPRSRSTARPLSSVSRRSDAPAPSSRAATGGASSEEEEEMRVPVPKARRVPATSSSAPPRKARRVLLRPTQDVEEDDNGVPIVIRKRAK